MKHIGHEVIVVWPAGNSSSAEAPVSVGHDRKGTTTDCIIFYRPCASFTNVHLRLLNAVVRLEKQ